MTQNEVERFVFILYIRCASQCPKPPFISMRK